MKEWLKKNPNKIGVILWAIYSWLKAACAARLDYHFLPETDMLIMTALTALGLYSTTRPPPKT